MITVRYDQDKNGPLLKPFDPDLYLRKAGFKYQIGKGVTRAVAQLVGSTKISLLEPQLNQIQKE